jgi:hypothetical protein
MVAGQRFKGITSKTQVDSVTAMPTWLDSFILWNKFKAFQNRPEGLLQNNTKKTIKSKVKMIYQNVQHITNKNKIFIAFLHITTPNIFDISEHGLKDNEITECK